MISIQAAVCLNAPTCLTDKTNCVSTFVKVEKKYFTQVKYFQKTELCSNRREVRRTANRQERNDGNEILEKVRRHREAGEGKGRALEKEEKPGC